VHGLTGDATSTWQAKDATQPWPERKLAADLPEARIMTYGYDADIVHFATRASQNTVMEHSKNLLIRLINIRDQSSENRPLMFIAHSLGGLVCEKVRDLLTLDSQSPP
jgi:protein SERAC1